MSNTYKSNVDFLNFLPKRENWELSVSEVILSKKSLTNIPINFAQQIYQLISNVIKGGVSSALRNASKQNWINSSSKESYLLVLEISWYLGLKIAILRLLKPEFVAVKIQIESPQDVAIAVHYLKKIPNLKGLWLYGMKEESLSNEWAELQEVEYLFLKDASVLAKSAFIEKFKENDNLKKISFGFAKYFIIDSHRREVKNEITRQLNRLDAIKSLKHSDVFISFPSDLNKLPHELKMLKYICVLIGINVEKINKSCNLLLYSDDKCGWFDSYEKPGFHSYITKAELKKWICDSLNINLKAFNTEEDFDALPDFFYSKDEANILIALNMLLHSEGINKTMFSLVIATYHSFVSNSDKDKNDIKLEILKLSEEIISQYIPRPIWTNYKKLLSQAHIAKDNQILKGELLTFFKEFNTNESQIQEVLLSKNNTYHKKLQFLINLDEDEKLPAIIEDLKTFSFNFISIQFIGTGDIVPTTNRITSCMTKLNSLNLSSLNTKGLDIGLSKGTVESSVITLSMINFYSKMETSIKFPNVETLAWWEGGDLMHNIGNCFPLLNDLRIRNSEANILSQLYKSNKFNLESVKDTLSELSISRLVWQEGFSKSLGHLTNLERLHIERCGLTKVPEEIFQLKKLKRLDLSRNHIHEFPRGLQNLDNLKELFLMMNELKLLPRKLEFKSLQILALGYNQIRNSNFSTKKSPMLTSVDLNMNNIREINIAFFNENLHRKTSFAYSNNPKIKLPSINEIIAAKDSFKAVFSLKASYIDEKTKAAYMEKFPDNFKF